MSSSKLPSNPSPSHLLRAAFVIGALVCGLGGAALLLDVPGSESLHAVEGETVSLEEAGTAAAECLEAAADQDEEGARRLAQIAVAGFEAHLDATPGDSAEDVPTLLRLAEVRLACQLRFAGMMERATLAHETEGLYRRALEVAPESVPAHQALGVLLYHLPPFLGRTEDAVQELSWVVEHAEEHGETPAARVFVMLGELHRRQEREDEARAVWRRGLEIHPQAEALLERLGEEPKVSETSGVSRDSPGAADFDSAGVAAEAAPARLRALLEAAVEQPGAAGLSVAVARDGRPVLTAGFGEADLEDGVAASPHTVYRLGSVSKQFTAALLLRLVQEGQLSLTDPLRRWLPETAAGAYGDVTLHQLLSHTAGLPRDVAEVEDIPGGWIERSLAQEPVASPGQRLHYSNLGYGLLGEVAERAEGADFQDLMQTKILQPLGLDATHFCDARRIVPHRADGHQWLGDRLLHAEPFPLTPALRAAGGLCSTVEDLLAWQQALRAGEVIAPELVRRMATPATVADPAGTSYGYGLHRRQQEGREVIHHGGLAPGFFTELAYYPTAELDVVILSNSEALAPRPLAARVAAIVLDDASTTPDIAPRTALASASTADGDDGDDGR